MNKFKEIRPIVLGLVKNGNKLLVSKGYDKSKKQEFYRCLGGGIEFLEKSEDAYQEKYNVIDTDLETEALWIDINRFKNKELILYPEQIFEYL